MPTPTKGPRLGGGPAHERLILANLATQLFEHRSITTTEAKAKRVRPYAERLITFAKRGDLASRRRVMTTVRDKSVVHFLFTEIAPAMAERPGGYTRITKIGNRKGDNAPMAVIELVMEPLSAKKATVREAEAATKRSVKEIAAKAAAAPAKAVTEVAQESAAASAVPAAAVADAVTEPVAPAAASAVASGEDLVAAGSVEEVATTTSVADKVIDEAPYGSDSALPGTDGSAPAGFDIKGNKDSMKFHQPDGRWYEQTVAEVYFRTAAAAEAAGFTEAGKPAKES